MHKMYKIHVKFYHLPQSIVTGAGDETLRFWNIFPSMKAPVSVWRFDKIPFSQYGFCCSPDKSFSPFVFPGTSQGF